MEELKELGNNLYQVNLVELDHPGRTTAYIIKGEKNILIETGASPSNPIIKAALEELEIGLEALDYIIVTHIHLDHAGGAGLLMSQCPNATLLVHPKGAAHLIDSTKLEGSARAVYGAAFDLLFAPIMDVPEARTHLIADDEEIEIGEGRVLSFYYAEGHSLSHFVVFDELTGSIFSGDALGMCYPALKAHYNVDLVLPASTPTQFDPKAMLEFVNHAEKLEAKQICFAHFGVMEDVPLVIKELKKWIKLFGTEAPKYYKKHHRFEALKDFMMGQILDELEIRGVPRDNEVINKLLFDIDLDAQGIVAYVKRSEKPSSRG